MFQDQDCNENYDQLITNNKQDNPFEKLQIMVNISSM